MDYKRLKEDNAARGREKKYTALLIIMTCITALLIGSIISVWSLARRYKILYDESCEAQIKMHEQMREIEASMELAVPASEPTEVNSEELPQEMPEELPQEQPEEAQEEQE